MSCHIIIMNKSAEQIKFNDHARILHRDSAFQRLDFPLEAREVHQYFVYGPHAHDGFVEIVLVTGGMATHILGSYRHPIGIGDLLVIPEGVVHCYENLADLRYYNILFDPHALQLPLDELRDIPGSELFMPQANDNPPPCCHLRQEHFAAARKTALELNNIIAQKIPGVKFAARTRLMMLLDLLCRSFAESANQKPPPAVNRLTDLVSELDEKYARAWTIEEMCRIAALSRPILFREFQKVFNTTPMDYLLNIRMRHACIMLQESSRSISEIAAACGFKDSSYFSSRFRRRTNLTPVEFRNQSCREYNSRNTEIKR